MQRLGLAVTGFFVLILVVLPTLIAYGCRAPAPGPAAPAADLPVTVYFPATRSLRTMPLKDFLVGVVAAEVPPRFADEAIKAQMVVARTYTVRHMRRFGGRGCLQHPQADACAAAESGQAYTDLRGLEAKLGQAEARRYWERLQAAEAATRGLVITYAGQPIDAVYHSTSGQLTESAAAVWGQDVPYLRPVPDPWGQAAPRYRETIKLSLRELAGALGVGQLSVPAAGGQSPVQVIQRTPGGRAARVQVGETILPGRDFRARLGLRSTNFKAWMSGDQLVIETQGYGHGVGMSQWGAHGMAMEGRSFREIIAHYYPGTRIQSWTRR